MAIQRSNEFSFRVSERQDEIAIDIAGSIDETSVMKLTDVGGRRVRIDPSGVSRMNSLGTRAWIVFMQELGAQTADIVLVKVPAVLVTQASMISTFLGRARVESFMTPWVCLGCDNAIEQIHGINDTVPESITCPSCGQQMELDWDRESYLAFRGGN